MKYLAFFLFTFGFSFTSFGYVDLSVNYTFSRNVIEPAAAVSGEDLGRAISTTEGYNAIWAWYIWDYTAIEFNFAQSINRVVDDRQIATDDESLTIISSDSKVKTIVSGVGIRQSFASRKSTFIPSISIGYAEFVTSGTTTYELEDDGIRGEVTIDQASQRQSSSYATVQLRIRITELLGLSLAAKTVMPEFDTSKAENNVTYSAGFFMDILNNENKAGTFFITFFYEFVQLFFLRT